MEIIEQRNPKTHVHPTRIFEVVDEFPDGYIVWNIGRNNFKHKGYIPLCKDDNNFQVDFDSLKAIYVGSEEVASKIAKEAGEHVVGKKRFIELV